MIEEDEECDHFSAGLEELGKMESTPIDSVYVVPCKCYGCGKTVYEKYYYEGVILDKENPEG